MICVTFFRNNDNNLYGFEINNHGDEIVCAAVSVLSINLVNSIECFTKCDFTFDYDEVRGYMFLSVEEVKNGSFFEDVDLLLKSFELGIITIEEQYRKKIKIKN